MTAPNRDTWPAPEYHVGPRDHIHALGVAAATYNDLEFALLLLFNHYMAVEGELGLKLFAALTNRTRLDFLSDAADAKEADPDALGCVKHFVRAFNICAENRNFLMHSTTQTRGALAALMPENVLTLSKHARDNPAVRNYAHLTRDEIRRIADEAYKFYVFGFQIWLWMLWRSSKGTLRLSKLPWPPTLPEKPPLPRKLTLSRSQDPPADEPLPGS